MNFESDLTNIVKQQFSKVGIRYDDSMEIGCLISRYFEMQNRRIAPEHRRVHFSDELHDSLGKLARETNAAKQENAHEAWGGVFFIRHLLVEGENVIRFLSKNVNRLISTDGLLWDFGMHHFHLSKKVEESGFVKRSGYLLYAIITQTDAYFVDIRPHPKRRDLGWVQQYLLKVVHSNWPELIEPNVLPGVTGSELTDKEKQELRRKNCNHATQLGGSAIAPLGGGTMSDGSSSLCRWNAMKLLHEINRHQCYFDSQPAELRAQLEDKGVEISDKMEFRLVQVTGLNLAAELIDSLTENQCLSRDLCRMGFVVVEASTRLVIVVKI